MGLRNIHPNLSHSSVDSLFDSLRTATIQSASLYDLAVPIRPGGRGRPSANFCERTDKARKTYSTLSCRRDATELAKE